MGQEPNIELGMSDLPRPRPHPAPARRWSPRRPGEVTSSADMPWGGAFGTTGPDPGYALKLVRRRRPAPSPGERPHDVDAGLAAVATARASRFGRAPTHEDVDVALVLLGYDTTDLPSDLVEGLRRDRGRWLANIAHDPVGILALVAAVPIPILESKPGALRAQMATGRRLIDR